MKFVDVHSHISFSDYDSDREAVLARMKEADVGTITVGVDRMSSRAAVACAEQYEGVYASIGLHPTDTTNETFTPEDYVPLVTHPKVVAIGECGLDYHRAEGATEQEKVRQKNEFLKQVAFAVEYGKPLMIHCRPSRGVHDAHEDMLSLLGELKKAHGERLRGNIHFFTGTSDIARRYGDLGFTVSFPGVITFAPELAETVRTTPLWAMLVETDAPWAAPLPHRGKRNEPSLVTFVMEHIAEIKGLSVADVATQIRENTRRTFGI